MKFHIRYFWILGNKLTIYAAVSELFRIISFVPQEGNEAKSRNPSGNQEGDKGQGKPPGGGNLEKLSKEELIVKCRNLLAIAQKAKTAKDGKCSQVFSSCRFSCFLNSTTKEQTNFDAILLTIITALNLLCSYNFNKLLKQ